MKLLSVSLIAKEFVGGLLNITSGSKNNLEGKKTMNMTSRAFGKGVLDEAFRVEVAEGIPCGFCK